MRFATLSTTVLNACLTRSTKVLPICALATTGFCNWAAAPRLTFDAIYVVNLCRGTVMALVGATVACG